MQKEVPAGSKTACKIAIKPEIKKHSLTEVGYCRLGYVRLCMATVKNCFEPQPDSHLGPFPRSKWCVKPSTDLHLMQR
jgi:hypothetical protein